MGPYLVRGCQADLCIAVRSSARFVVGSKRSGSGVRRIDLSVALIDCDPQLLGGLYGFANIGLVTGYWGRSR